MEPAHHHSPAKPEKGSLREQPPILLLALAGGLGGVALMTGLSLLYGFELPTYNAARWVSHSNLVTGLAIVATLVASGSLLAMKRWALALPVLAAGLLMNLGLAGYRNFALYQRNRPEQEYQAQQQNMADTAARLGAVCDGGGVGEAAPYTPAPGLHPMLALARADDGTSYALRALGRPWETGDIRSVQLVACLSSRAQQVDLCEYEEGYSLRLRQEELSVRVVEARTGRSVGELRLLGEDPRPCPGAMVSGDASERLGAVTDVSLANALSAYANGAATP